MATPPPEDSIVDAHLSEPETPSLSRYDATLLAIPLPYLLVMPVWLFTPLSVTVALIAGSVPAIPLMYEALLRRPPISDAAATEQVSADD
jgi:hypothetical protein